MTVKEVREYKTFVETMKDKIKLDDKDINKWCDLIEISCYLNKDKLLFREDLEREVERLVDGGFQLAALKDIIEQMGYDLSDSEVFTYLGSSNFGSDSSAKSDLLNQVTNAWFEHLLIRAELFGRYYPFSVKKNLTEISCKSFPQLTKKNKLYMQLLITANRNGLSQSLQRRLEFDFEPIAFESFKCLIPQNGEAHLFGKGRYSTTKFEKKKYSKFEKLAHILCTIIKVTESDYSANDTGDSGIDFLGWHKLDNILPNHSVFVGQATCMKEWDKKCYESSVQALGGLLDTSKIGNHVNSLFIPYHFSVGDNWAYPRSVEGREYLLFDRFRILNNIGIKNIKNNIISTQLLEKLGS